MVYLRGTFTSLFIFILHQIEVVQLYIHVSIANARKELKPQRAITGLHFSEKLIETLQINIALNITSVNQILFFFILEWIFNDVIFVKYLSKLLRNFLK